MLNLGTETIAQIYQLNLSIELSVLSISLSLQFKIGLLTLFSVTQVCIEIDFVSRFCLPFENRFSELGLQMSAFSTNLPNVFEKKFVKRAECL